MGMSIDNLLIFEYLKKLLYRKSFYYFYAACIIIFFFEAFFCRWFSNKFVLSPIDLVLDKQTQFRNCKNPKANEIVFTLSRNRVSQEFFSSILKTRRAFNEGIEKNCLISSSWGRESRIEIPLTLYCDWVVGSNYYNYSDIFCAIEYEKTASIKRK